MRKLTPSDWLTFQDKMKAMDSDASPEEILRSILNWLRERSEIFLEEPFASYGFNRFLDLQEMDYPVSYSEMRGTEFQHFIKIISKYSQKDRENIARCLSNVMEALIVFKVDQQCLSCDSWGVGVYKDARDARLALECSTCTLAHYLDGSRVMGNGLIFATIADLEAAGFISDNVKSRHFD